MDFSKAWKKGFLGMESIRTVSVASWRVIRQDQGPWSLCEVEEKAAYPSLPLPQAPPALSWDAAEVQLIHQHVFLFKK